MKEVKESKYDRVVELTRAWEIWQRHIDDKTSIVWALGGEREIKDIIAEIKKEIRSLINNKEYVAEVEQEHNQEI